MGDAAGPRRLRLVVARYGAEIVGGAERLTRLLAHALRDRGWAISVVTTRALDERTWANELPAGPAVVEGVAVERHGVRAPRRPRAFHEISRAFWHLPAPVRPERLWLTLQGPWSPSLERALRDRPEPPTLFVSYLYRPSVFGLPSITGPRLLLPTAHDEPPLRLQHVRRMLAAADGLLYATPEERGMVEARHPGAARLPAEVGNVAVDAPAGIDARRFRATHGVRPPYLLYGGRATQGKGLDELLAGLRRLRASHPSVSLVLTGDAGARSSREPGVVAVGVLDDTARWDAIAGAAAVVVPSFHESLSLLALEGWAAGRPALVNGASPVLAGQVERSGGGVAYRGPDGLAAAAADLLGSPARGDDLGAAGRRHVAEAYTWDAVVGRIESLLAAAEPAAAARRARPATAAAVP